MWWPVLQRKSELFYVVRWIRAASWRTVALLPLREPKLKKQSPKGVLQKSCSGNLCKIYRKTPVSESLVNKVADCSCNFITFCEVFQNGFYADHLCVTFSESKTLKVQSCKLKKHWWMIAYMLQKCPENFAFQLFIILQ